MESKAHTVQEYQSLIIQYSTVSDISDKGKVKCSAWYKQWVLPVMVLFVRVQQCDGFYMYDKS